MYVVHTAKWSQQGVAGSYQYKTASLVLRETAINSPFVNLALGMISKFWGQVASDGLISRRIARLIIG